MSRTLSGLFLVERTRSNRENPRTIPEQIGKIPEKSGKSQKGQKRTKKEGQVQIGKPPRLKPPRLAALECSHCAKKNKTCFHSKDSALEETRKNPKLSPNILSTLTKLVPSFCFWAYFCQKHSCVLFVFLCATKMRLSISQQLMPRNRKHRIAKSHISAEPGYTPFWHAGPQLAMKHVSCLDR